MEKKSLHQWQAKGKLFACWLWWGKSNLTSIFKYYFPEVSTNPYPTKQWSYCSMAALVFQEKSEDPKHNQTLRVS